ncbi:MAG TPA: hypothetical protein VEJ40_01540 [Pseudolabrys sp.]|nr:hypothetical protein [Pseudolabrys sp.]
MDKTLHAFFNGVFALFRGPLIFLILTSIVISVARHTPARLARAHPQAITATLGSRATQTK